MDLAISKPITLPSGLVLPNRLVKAAMAEALCKDGVPTPTLKNAYSVWADGGWGLVLTGNVHVDARYLGQPGDISLQDGGGSAAAAAQLAAWREWAAACRCAAGGSPTIMQINHPGRQCPAGAGSRGFFEKAPAPSAVPLALGDGLLAKLVSALVFGTPRAMTAPEVEDVVARFAAAARRSAEAGFDGVELHAAHGYLLAQFLSADVNRRTDAYGGSAVGRAKIVVDIIRAVREATPAGFTVGIKLNSVDHQSESAFGDCLEQLQAIVDAGIDFVEVSGGSYEDPLMVRGIKEEKKSDRTKAREAFFIDFAKAIRDKFPKLPLMLTGGFLSRQGMEAAVLEAGCDLVGLGRPAVLNPILPKTVIFNPEVKDEDAKLFVKHIEAPWIAKQIGAGVGAGAVSQWYSQRIGEMAKL